MEIEHNRIKNPGRQPVGYLQAWPRIWTRGTTENKSSKSPERDSNRGPPDCESDALTARLSCLPCRIGEGDSEKLPTYPSPNPTFCSYSEVSVYVELGRGREVVSSNLLLTAQTLFEHVRLYWWGLGDGGGWSDTTRHLKSFRLIFQLIEVDFFRASDTLKDIAARVLAVPL